MPVGRSIISSIIMLAFGIGFFIPGFLWFGDPGSIIFFIFAVVFTIVGSVGLVITILRRLFGSTANP